MTSRQKVEVCYVSRVEGQGAINVEVGADGKVKRSEFAIFEPMRFFEALLRGRKFSEVHEISSRICGICPITHQITALRAVENAYGLEVSDQTRDLRRLMALSGWIQSHSLSVFFLTAPDYLGYDGVVSMAADHRDIAEMALRLKKLGNDIGELVGGRAIHPISMVVGGFTKVPTRDDLEPFEVRLEGGLEDMSRAADLLAGFDYPRITGKSELIAISDSERYAVNEGRMASTEGLDVPEDRYRTRIVEEQVAHSNAKQSRVKDRGVFMVGPLARVVLNGGKLSRRAGDLKSKIGLERDSTDPFMNIKARAVEITYALEESLDIIRNLGVDVAEQPAKPHVGVPCQGAALTEAPRGLLYHAYRFDKSGAVVSCDIVPPTAHNSAHVERSMRELGETAVANGEDLTQRCEMLVRAYDPCISCSVHAFHGGS
jgi:coenzyme F420-reducing hydrogenase alpha subunit